MTMLYEPQTDVKPFIDALSAEEEIIVKRIQDDGARGLTSTRILAIRRPINSRDMRVQDVTSYLVHVRSPSDISVCSVGTYCATGPYYDDLLNFPDTHVVALSRSPTLFRALTKDIADEVFKEDHPYPVNWRESTLNL